MQLDRDAVIFQIVEFNLEQCQADTTFNDQLIHDLLMYGTKGLENMTDAELWKELANCSFDTIDSHNEGE